MLINGFVDHFFEKVFIFPLRPQEERSGVDVIHVELLVLPVPPLSDRIKGDLLICVERYEAKQEEHCLFLVK